MTSLPVPEPLQRVHGISVEEFLREFAEKQIPVVVTGAFDDSPARGWTFQWLRENYGTHEVSATGDEGFRAINTTLGEYIERVQAGVETSYLQQLMVDELPGLREGIDLRWRSAQTRMDFLQMFVGPAGSGVGFHTDNRGRFDISNNTVMQLVGTKRWWLVPPSEDEQMYAPPRHPTTEHSRISPVHHLHADLEKFPLFAKARVLEVDLGPGELMFVPGAYWHATLAPAPTLSVTYWWPQCRLMEVALAGGRQMPLELSDIEVFGGVQKFCEAWQPNGLELKGRRNLLANLSDEARNALNAWRQENGMGSLEATLV